MEHQLCVLLYSKYSPNSKALLDTIKKSPVDLAAVSKLTTLCIDNEEIRQRIMKSSDIDIQVVPCILIIFQDGGVEKYEGQTAFDWTENIIRHHSPPPPPISRPPPQLRQNPPKRIPKPQIEEEEEYEDEYEPPPPRRRKAKQQPPSEPRKRRPRPPPAKQSTSIDDLMDEDELEDYTPQRPPVNVRDGAGAFQLSDEFGEFPEPSITESQPENASTRKSATLMAAAAAMQKDRESGDSSNRPPNMPAR